MQIFVKTLTGKTVTLQVEDSTLVMDIKTKIEEKEGIPIYRQTLVNGNKILHKDHHSLSSYNVFNEATLQMTLRWTSPDTEVENNQCKRRNENSKNTLAKKKDACENENGENTLTKKKDTCENDKNSLNKEKDACEKFQDRLVKSMTLEMNRELTEKTVAFKKLCRIGINAKVSELEDKKNRNERELIKRNQFKTNHHSGLQKIKLETLKHKQIIDQKILELQKQSKNCELVIRDKETMMKEIIRKQVEDTNQTAKENEKLEEEISTLKQKRIDIEREENDLLNNKKVRVNIEREENDLINKKKVNADLVEFISNTIEEKEKDLECPVCFEIAEVPIFRCDRDHLICNKCLPKLKICPECRKHYPKSPVRNRYAERQVEEIKKLSAKRKAILDGV